MDYINKLSEVFMDKTTLLLIPIIIGFLILFYFSQYFIIKRAIKTAQLEEIYDTTYNAVVDALKDNIKNNDSKDIENIDISINDKAIDIASNIISGNLETRMSIIEEKLVNLSEMNTKNWRLNSAIYKELKKDQLNA